MAQFSGKPYFQIPRPIRRKGMVNAETLAAGKTLVAKDSYYQVLDPDGVNRDITLPPEDDGISYVILNSGNGGFDLVVKNDAGTQIGSNLTNGSTNTFVCDGTTWYAI